MLECISVQKIFCSACSSSQGLYIFTWGAAAACVSSDALLAHQTLVSLLYSLKILRCSTRYFSIRSGIRSTFCAFWTGHDSSLQEPASLFVAFQHRVQGSFTGYNPVFVFLIFLLGEGVPTEPVFAYRQSCPPVSRTPTSLTGPQHHPYSIKP